MYKQIKDRAFSRRKMHRDSSMSVSVHRPAKENSSIRESKRCTIRNHNSTSCPITLHLRRSDTGRSSGHSIRGRIMNIPWRPTVHPEVRRLICCLTEQRTIERPARWRTHQHRRDLVSERLHIHRRRCLGRRAADVRRYGCLPVKRLVLRGPRHPFRRRGWRGTAPPIWRECRRRVGRQRTRERIRADRRVLERLSGNKRLAWAARARGSWVVAEEVRIVAHGRLR